MYTVINFKTKRELKEAVASGIKRIRVYQPNADLTGAIVPTDGAVTLEGPHYPSPHTWYAQAVLKNGVIIRVR